MATRWEVRRLEPVIFLPSAPSAQNPDRTGFFYVHLRMILRAQLHQVRSCWFANRHRLAGREVDHRPAAGCAHALDPVAHAHDACCPREARSSEVLHPGDEQHLLASKRLGEVVDFMSRHKPHAPLCGEVCACGARGVAMARGDEVDPGNDCDVVQVGDQRTGLFAADGAGEREYTAGGQVAQREELVGGGEVEVVDLHRG